MHVKVLVGDAVARLREIPDQSVHCCVTSPPYWGLRSYQGDPGMIGLEPTFEKHLENLLTVFREVRRVLRDDGVLFLNYGDAYVSSGASRAAQSGTDGTTPQGLTDDGWTYQSLCGECAAVLESRSLGTPGPAHEFGGASQQSTPTHTEVGDDHVANSDFCRRAETSADRQHSPAQSAVVVPDAPVFTTPRSSPLPLDACLHSPNGEFCREVLRSSDPYALACAHTGWRLRKDGRGVPVWARRIERKDALDSARRYSTTSSLKSKDLMMMSARVAMALQADGWWLRSEICWAKPNPMPESATDRPTTAHEKIFLFAKSGRTTYWTHDWLSGVRSKPEPDHYWMNRETRESVDEPPADWKTALTGDGKKLWSRRNRWVGHDYFYDHVAVRTPIKAVTTKMPDGWETDPGAHGTIHRKGRVKGEKTKPKATQYDKEYLPGEDKDYKSAGVQDDREIKARIVASKRRAVDAAKRKDTNVGSLRPDKNDQWGGPRQGFGEGWTGWDDMTKEETQANGANLRNVWSVASESYKGAHFATFPRKIVEPCIKAGTSAKGCCPECGAPWERNTFTPPFPPSFVDKDTKMAYHARALESRGGQRAQDWRDENPTVTTGWLPTCECDAGDPVPCTVLDPFAGSGTTGNVALNMNRDAVLVEISPEYVKLIRERTEGEFGMLCKLEIL